MDLDYLISIIVKLRDDASPGIARLRAEIDSLKSSQDADNATKDLGRSTEDLGKKAEKTEGQQRGHREETERTRRAADDAGRALKDTARAVDEHGKSHERSAESVSEHVKSLSDADAALKEVRKSSKDAESGLRDLELRIQKVDAANRSIEDRRRSGLLSSDEVKRFSQDFSREYGNIANSMRRVYGIGSEEADRYRQKSEEALRASKEAAKLARGDDGSKTFEALNESLSGAGSGFRITGVASFLRGLQDLTKIGLSQQLITGVASLAGSFISLASAAAQAGAALAGAFVSGLGQAIPMISIVAASVERFKSILQAVSITSQAEQQHYYDPTEKQRTQLQNTSQLISSQQQLSNSYVQLYESQQRVRDSQIALTEARYNAIRNITELSLAEKNARLQAEGATLSLTEARRQLQIAIQRGDTAGLASAELAVREAELGKQRAEFEIPKAEREARLARQRGVSGAPTVISATEGLAAARQGVVQARQAAEAAQRQEQITRLAQQARSSRETSQEAQLSFLKKGMSSTELGLYDALVSIEKELKSPDSPLKKITDYFVEPFTNAVQAIRGFLKDKSFITPIDELAKSMGEGLGRLEKFTYGKQGEGFFLTMAHDASANIPIVVSAIEHLMHLFEDIAKAADPAFHKLSEDWDKFWNSLDRKYSSEEGLSGLERFFNRSVKFAEGFAHLGKSITDLFLAIGHDAAPQGLQTVTTFSQTVEKATSWIQSHTPEVTKFFKEAREGLSTIGGLLFSIGKDFLEAFSLSSLRALSGFLSQFLLPGLRDVVNVIGKITTAILNFFNLFGSAGHKALEAIAAFVLGFLAIAKAIELVKELQKAFIELKIIMMESPWVAIATGILSAAAALGIFDEGQKKNKVSTEEVKEALERQADALRVIKNLNDEYKGSKLGVEEAKLQVTSSEQSLAKIRREPLQTGEKASERALRIKQSEQELTRAQLSYSERQKEFSELPARQTETLQKEKETNRQSVSSARTRYSQIYEEIKGLEQSKHQSYTERLLGEEPNIPLIDSKIIAKKKELQEAQEKVGIATKKSSEIIVSANESTAHSAPKLSEAYEEAFKRFSESVGRGRDTASKGMSDIRTFVDEALKKYGVSPAEVSGSKSTVVVHNRAGGPVEVPTYKPKYASGAYISARPGGHIANIGEGGHDEVILSTDPRHAARSRSLLGQYFSRAPHMAAGGYVSPFHGAATQGRTDQGVDYNLTPGAPITSIGEARIKGVIPNWFQGQPFLWYELLSGLDKGRNVYVAEQINKLAKVGSIVKAGQPIAYYAPSGTGIEIGWATSGGQTLAASTTGYTEGQITPAGASFKAFLSGLAHGQVIAGGAAAAQAIQQIIAPKVKGGGAIGQVVQSALNIATKAANIYLGKQGGSAGATGKSSVIGNLKGKVVTASEFGGHNDPSAFMHSTASGKIANDTLMGFAELSNPPGSLNFSALGGLPMGTRIKVGYNGRYITIPKVDVGAGGPGLDGHVRAIDLTYAASRALGTPGLENVTWQRMAMGGIIGDHIRRLGIRQLRKKILKFAQGGIAPWGGRPVPIIAHEGERIMNPAQYHETARLAGTSPSGLDHHLGYNSSSPRQSFADGGPVIRGHTTQAPSASVAPFSLPAFPEFQNFSESEIGSVSVFLKIFKVLKEGFKKLGKLNVKSEKYTTELTKFINEITNETSGVLARLLKGREILKSSLAREAVSRTYVSTDRGGQLGNRGGAFGSGGVPLGGVKLGPGGQVSVDVRNILGLVNEAKYMDNEAKVIRQAEQKIKADISNAKKLKGSARTTALTNLNGAYNKLKEQQRELGESISQNIEARYQAETQRIQDEMAKAEGLYQVISQQQGYELSKAQTLGNLDQVGGIEQSIKQGAEFRISQLEVNVKEAESIGNTEEADNIKQKIIGLRQTVTNSVVEQINTAISLIERESGERESFSQGNIARSKIQAQLGNFQSAGEYEKVGLEERGTNLRITREKEIQEREKAEREGITTDVISLTEKLNENTTQTEENNLALRENAVVTRELIVNQIEQTGQFKKGIYGSAISGLEIIGKTTGFTNVKGLIEAAKGEGAALETERSGLEGQAKGLGLNVEGMTPAQILSYLASPEGQTKLSQLESKEDKSEKEQMYKLVQALEGNATATLQNTEKLAELNGQLNQPQTWSTVAQTAFRNSIFSGMGQLLPQYQSALPVGAAPTELPAYGMNAPVQQRGPAIGSLSLTHPVEKLDTQLFGEEVSHHIATAPVIQ